MSCRNQGICPKKFSKLSVNGSTSFWSCVYGYGCSILILGLFALIFNNAWFGAKFGSLDELVCAVIYAVYITMYVYIIRKFKDVGVFRRFVMPIIAIIGAVFLDGGIDAAKSLIKSRIIERLESASVDALDRDYKTMLQEYVQHGHIGQLRYALDTAEGPEHQKRFTMSVLLGESRIGSGAGGSKQSAGQAAAKAALDHLKQYNATKRE